MRDFISYFLIFRRQIGHLSVLFCAASSPVQLHKLSPFHLDRMQVIKRIALSRAHTSDRLKFTFCIPLRGRICFRTSKSNRLVFITSPTHPPKFCHNSFPVFLRFRAIYRFWPRISVVKNHFKNSCFQIQIRIFTKIELICPYHTPKLYTKFCSNPPYLYEISCSHTTKQTERPRVKTQLPSTFGGKG